MTNSVTCRTASGGSWGFWRLGQADQKIAECVHIRDGCYNAGSHYGLNVQVSLSKQDGRIWPFMRKSQHRKVAGDCNIEASQAESFWHVIRVYCLRLLRLIRHC
jgi:hypothetical protein